MKTLCYRTDLGNGNAWYVAQLPARKGSKRAIRDGVDWGYTSSPLKALDLSLYWQKRFNADMRRVGHEAHSITI